MKYVVEAGTDAASLLLFDPCTLPEEFDAANETGDATDLLDGLHDAGRLFWINTEGDGGYLLHAFVNEEPPTDLQQFMRDPKTSNNFTVAGGAVYFMGAEYGYRDDDSQFRRTTGMGGSFPVENGDYDVTLYRTEYPVGLLEETFRQRATSVQLWLHETFNTFAALAVVSVLAALVSFVFTTWTVWLHYVIPSAILMVTLPICLSRLKAFRNADRIWKDVNCEFPTIVATLSSKSC